MKEVFLASRFREFENLRKNIILHFKDSKKIKIINLDPNGVDIRTPTIKSVETVSYCNFLLLLVGDTYGKIPESFDYSITHLEYITAKNNYIPMLCFYIGENDKLFQDSFVGKNEHLKLKELKKNIFGSINKNITPSFNKREQNLFDKVCQKIENFLKEEGKYKLSNNRQFEFGVRSLPNENIYLKREQELNEIKKFILNETSKQVGLVGMGGVGKSVIASDIAYSKEIKDNFENVYSIEINQFPDIRNKIIELLEFIPENRDLDLTNISTNNGLNRLKTYFRNKKILLILDDVWDASIISKLNFINNESKILITTRNQSALTNSISYHINYLSEEQAEKLFYKINPTSIGGSIIKEIINKSGRLPLAITIIASKLKNKPIEFHENFINNYNISKISYPIQTDNIQHRNLFNVIDFTFNYFDESIKGDFLKLSIFPEGEMIRIETLETMIGNDWYSLISELIDNHLISKEKDLKDNNVFYLHDLIRDYIIEKSNKKTIEIHKHFLNSYNNKYKFDWNQIPPYDSFFLKNFILIANNCGEIDLAKNIAEKILFNHQELYISIVKIIIDFLKLNNKDVANKIINLNKSIDTIKWCFKILGNDNQIVINKAENFLLQKNINNDIIKSSLNVLNQQNLIAVQFVRKYVLIKSNQKSDAFVSVLKFSGNNKMTYNLCKNILSIKDKSTSKKLQLYCLNRIGKKNKTSIEYAQNIDSINDKDLIIFSILTLGHNHRLIKRFAKKYLTTNNILDSDITVHSIKALGDNDIVVNLFCSNYLNNSNQRDSDIIVRCMKSLGSNNNDVILFAKKYLKSINNNDSDIVIQSVKTLGKNHQLSINYAENYLKSNFDNIKIKYYCNNHILT